MNETELYDRFELLVPLDEVQEILRNNTVETFLPFYARYVQLAKAHAFHTEGVPAPMFVVHFLEHMRVKYNLHPRLHPISYRKGYTFRGKRIGR